LGLYPGESFEFLSKHQKSFAKKEKILGRANAEEPAITFDEKVSTEEFISFDSFMRQMVECSSLYNSERVFFDIRIAETGYSTCFEFGSKEDSPLNISVEIPLRIFKMLALGRANWDHVAIGYWGSWSRKPNRYPTNFMRLLQSGVPAGYNFRHSFTSKAATELGKSSIADLLERNPGEVSTILTRVGLPCGSCALTNTETLNEALMIHNVDLDANVWFLRELAAAVEFPKRSTIS
jgi:hypothetical protein